METGISFFFYLFKVHWFTGDASEAKFVLQLQVAEEYRLVPDTLYLTVNYIDRYLSGNPMNRQRLQLLGVACMMIAS